MSDKKVRWSTWEKTMNLRFVGGQLMQQHRRDIRLGSKTEAHYVMHCQTKWVKVK